ncbi:histidine phosphatase family protein [Candidatus Woesearchaeota archaeon]|nr:histidine phosphatase family protein [Candidatus Woesearchaeota archaeon]
MKQLYLIRHGDADYYYDCLTDEGRARVRGLSRTLMGLLPDRIRYSVVSSPSGRAKETAQLLLPVLSEKSGEMLHIYEDPRLSELRSMGNEEEMREYGKQNLVLLDEYNSGIGVFIAHERIIRAMAFAVSEKFEITLPEKFHPGQAYTRMLLMALIREHNYTEKRAIAAVQELPNPFINNAVIRPGYGLNFGLELRTFSVVTPDY